MEESFTEDNSIGFKLQQFYVALRSLNSADIAWYLSLIETHVPNLDIGETSTIVNELIFDCRSKCTQYFRAVYGEQIRNLIASSRKKIHSKAAVEIHASSQHHQRHIVILIDLLGSWSNMILELSSFGLSPIVRQMIALPLHGRIREMVLEIFFAFKEDKNLDKLQSRILSHQDQMLKSKNDMNTATLNAPSSSYKIPVSFSTLDQILVQLTTIRETVNQYYSFLRAHLLAPVSDIAEFLDVDIGSDGGSVAISTETQVYTILNELNIDWRESDAYYISLEYGYITEALVDALSCSSLLETENMTLIPQSIEDAFFLFRRISERSIIGFNEQTIFAIANKIIELLDPSQDSNIYLIASEKKYFFNCTTRQSIIVPDSLKATSGNTFNATATDAQKSNSIPATPQIDLKAHGSNPSIVILPSSSSTSNISSNQPTDLGSWIVQALQDEVDTYEEQKAIKHISSGTSEVPSATSLLMTTGYSFLHQLVGDDSDEEDARQREHSRKVSVQQAAAGNISFSGTSNIDETDSGNTAEDSIMSRMKLVDFCVYLSTLVTCVTSIQSLRSFHIQALEFHQDIKRQQQQKHSTNEVSTAAVGLSNSNPLLLIQHELIRCIRGYHSLYQRDLRELVSLVFAQTFLPQLRVFFHSHSSFEIDGAAMDRLITEQPLSSLFRRLLQLPSSNTQSKNVNFHCGPNPNVASLELLLPRLCGLACKEMVTLLADASQNSLRTFFLSVRYSEWGALYIQHEISRLTASFSQAVDSFSVGDESQESISKSSTNINALNGMKSNSNSNISNGVHSSNSSANINGNADNITTSRSIRSIMQPLYWFGTIISLDSPGSIRRYAIPGSVLDDAGVRAVLSRRIDFSSDVVAKLKFNIVN